jgi:pyridinium-3,5-bisthiocarboxylic acid mononucleotide nickel chelatase
MLLGALLDAGLSGEALRGALTGLPVEGYRLDYERVTRQGISGHAVRVTLDRPDEQPSRHLPEVERIIQESSFAPDVREKACAVFRALGQAEAEVHGIPVAEVHFHEVGAVDSIVDVVGAVWGLRELGVEQVYASSLPTGSGTVKTAHGLLPVPAPATMALLANVGAPLRPSPAETELVTPTGAALLATLATFRQPAMSLRRVGYGFGRKTLPWPNVARLWIGELTEASDEDGFEHDTISVIEANLDDERPVVVGATMETLLVAGALDVYFTPIQMKKNRPAVKLSVLAPVELTRELSELIIRETSTLGVRTYQTDRLKCRRSFETVTTPWGEVRVKVKHVGNERRAMPEYEDCAALARQAGVPLRDVLDAAMIITAGHIETEGAMESPSPWERGSEEASQGERE